METKPEAVAAGDETLQTPSIVVSEPAIVAPVPEPPAVAAPIDTVQEQRIAETEEKARLSALASRSQTSPTQPELGSTIASDIPSLMAPFNEISSFSLGHTLPGSKWRLYPHLSLSAIYDDNIYLTSDHKVSDVYFAISPGIGAAYGADESALKVRADYTASFLIFSKESGQDTVDQNALMRVSYALPKLTLGLNLGFQSLSGASVDVGDRVRRQIYYIGITSNYILDEKFSFDLNADETFASYKGLLDSNEARIQTFLNYQATGKINVGAGATFGFLDVQEGPGQTYQQLLGRINYDATGKLVIYASGGVDLRETDMTTLSPVFNIGAAYSPTATTTISLDVHERIYGSAALEGQDYRATGFLVSLTQQLRRDLSAFVSVGFENASYFAVEKGIASDRVDNYTFVRVGPDWQVRPWWHLGAFYEYGNNASSGIGSRSFSRNRVGVQANFAF